MLNLSAKVLYFGPDSQRSPEPESRTSAPDGRKGRADETELGAGPVGSIVHS